VRVNESPLADENRDLKRRMASAATDLAFALMGDPGHPPALAALERAHATLTKSDRVGPVEPARAEIENAADGSTT